MSNASRYAPLQIGLHWLVFLLFVVNYIISDDMGRALRIKLDGGTPDQFAALIHPPVGIAILALTLIRLLVRARLGAPDLPPAPHPLMNRAAKLGHWLIYAGILLMTASGIAAWQIGIRAAGEVHEVAVNLTILLIAGHTLMALYHHFVLRDGLLDRMRPKRS